MEYRKKTRVDFAGLTSPHAIRFPADYVKFQERMTAGDIDQMNYLLGGRSVKFPGDVVFGLPPRNQGFDYNLRVYAKSDVKSTTVDGCVLERRGVQFQGFDLYEGNCQQQGGDPAREDYYLWSVASWGSRCGPGKAKACFFEG